ncbi:MAG: N-acetyltransferase family protein [Candidatus Velthaea sp.]
MKTSDAVTVRVARADDEDFVVGLARRFGDTRAAWRSYDEVVRGTERALHAAFAQRGPAAEIFIAGAADGEPLGFAYVVTHHDFFTGEAHGHISEIASVVDASGAGSALISACETWARECGYRYLSLNVNDTNPTAHAFYERRDYEPEYRHLAKLLR